MADLLQPLAPLCRYFHGAETLAIPAHWCWTACAVRVQQCMRSARPCDRAVCMSLLIRDVSRTFVEFELFSRLIMSGL